MTINDLWASLLVEIISKLSSSATSTTQQF